VTPHAPNLHCSCLARVRSPLLDYSKFFAQLPHALVGFNLCVKWDTVQGDSFSEVRDAFIRFSVVRKVTINVRIAVILVPAPINVIDILERNEADQKGVQIAFFFGLIICATLSLPVGMLRQTGPLQGNQKAPVIGADQPGAKPR
jgi:hypothetical protein